MKHKTSANRGIESLLLIDNNEYIKTVFLELKIWSKTRLLGKDIKDNGEYYGYFIEYIYV